MPVLHFTTLASLMASIWNKQHLCWRKFTQPAVRMTQCTESANVSECCVTLGLAHSKFPFPYAHIPATQFQFLKRMRCLCRDVWSSGEETQQAGHSESSTCLLLLVEKGTRLQWYKYNGAGVKMFWIWEKLLCNSSFRKDWVYHV